MAGPYQPTFIEPGTDDQAGFGNYSSTSGTVASATDQVKTGPRSIKHSLGSPATSTSVLRSGVLADAGRRITIWFRFDTVPTGNTGLIGLRDASNNSVYSVQITSTPTLRSNPVGATGAAGPTILSVNTWYRVTLSYTITNTTTFKFVLMLNGSTEVTSTTGTLTRTGTDGFIQSLGTAYGANANAWFDDLYVDDGADYTDPGNVVVNLPLMRGGLGVV